MKNTKKLLAVILALVMIFSTASLVSYGVQKEDSSLSFATMSDTHYYPASLTGNFCDAFTEYSVSSAKLYAQSETIISTAIETMVKRNPKLKYVLVPGDLTKDGEKKAHEELAALFEKYEEKYGLQFIIIDGNHDVNSDKASTFENGKEEKAPSVTADEFRNIYKNLGYDIAEEEYLNYYRSAFPEKDQTKIQNRLSYSVKLDDNYRLIVIDSAIYSQGTDAPKYSTNGEVTDELLSWVKLLTDRSKTEGVVPMVMIHHSLAPHMETEPSITFAFPLNDYLPVAEKFADWGISYVFSGHLHTNDISSVISDKGNVLYDCETASITGYPNTYREMTVSTKSGKSEMSYDAIEFDEAVDCIYDGKKFTSLDSFNACFGGLATKDGKADISSFLLGIVKSYLGKYLVQIKEAGSIDAFLKDSFNIDLREILNGFLSPYIKDGFTIGSYKIFTVDNLMWFINDLLGQVYDLYIKNPDALYNVIGSIVEKLINLKISDIPCDKFLEHYGFGNKTQGGTLGDAVLCAMVYWYEGNEDSSKDKFMNDVKAKFTSGENTQLVFDKVVDLILNDLLYDAILSKLEIRLGKLFQDKFIMKQLGDGVDYLVKVLLKGDNTYMNLVNIVFELGVLPYDDLYDVLDQLLLQKYLTQSQMEGTGTFIAYILSDFSEDENPKKLGDYDVTYSTDKLSVPLSTENYRLPTMVSVTFGEDTKTSAYINWFSKYSVGGDIEIYKSDSEPEFKGVPTKTADFNIEVKNEEIIRSFPGIDIGIAGFITYKFPMNRHTVHLTGLKENSTYYYRIGDSEKGWWSETGKISTADGSKNTTFFHMTDPQSQSKAQYERSWAAITKSAFETYPDADFIINTGDLADHPDNTKQWQWMFDTASETLMSTVMMPASGNHEGNGEYAIVNNFKIANAPKQDTKSGIYYSFDYNNIHFSVLNTNDLGEDKGLSKEQIDWLQKDVSSSTADWKFVALHKAPYSQGSHYSDKDVCAIRSQLQKLMPELGIDMVFEGHDHVYMRTGSLYDNSLTAYEHTYLKHNGETYRTQIKPSGTTYVISGTSGVKTYLTNDLSVTDKYFPRGEKAFGVDSSIFSAIEIEDGILYFTSYALDANGKKVVDRFAIQKNTAQGEKDEDYKEEPLPEEEKPNTFLSTLKSILSVVSKIVTVVKNILKIYVFER